MKYKTAKAFIAAIQSREFCGEIVVDNDQVRAYDKNDDVVFDFSDAGPQGALIQVLLALGAKAVLP